ncbi:MAG: hypothetical protein AB2693_11580 [Candidatus Thiodiazotropha sp.]
MTKTPGSAVPQLYAGIAGMFLPIHEENQSALISDLEDDKFVGHVLSAPTANYHCFGMFLAPLTAALITMKYCQFEPRCPIYMPSNDGGVEPTERASAGEPSCCCRDGVAGISAKRAITSAECCCYEETNKDSKGSGGQARRRCGQKGKGREVAVRTTGRQAIISPLFVCACDVVAIAGVSRKTES